MTYIRTHLKREIVIDSIITIHYFEYMKDFVFHGESHDFWEMLYVDKGSVQVRSGEDTAIWMPAISFSTSPGSFTPSARWALLRRTWWLSPLPPSRLPWISSARRAVP